ncbi:glycerophosphodiester phosphodiesterase [Actinospica durhamensis]|uniref:Glycerophosphodiester phosphodiesterase n=1 Tax=Actinospica durhamensis TaxID=1508375 RepID=A0A941EJH8_9ACTN|nr:glycerophosphodiester phosphodiesterase family protein [Actinospica durhamensis]MBR7831667.1 glycerophosphodiester phosphodiesterase [Actinospica durhamensis]
MGHSSVRIAPAAPQIVAHRGASTEAPEHTYAAYVAALEAGADALECDVRLTADGHLVCVHDGRVDRTSNGRGRVSALELARLEELDFGSWHAPADEPGFAGEQGDARDTEGAEAAGEPVELPDRDASRVLTLRRLLDLAAGHPKRVELAIEVKHPTRYAGRVERRLIEMLDEYGWVPRPGQDASATPVRVMSFSRAALRRVHRLAPAMPTVFLMEPFMYRTLGGALPAGAAIAGPSVEILRTRPECVERWHRAGRPVHVWTVDEPADFDLCLDLGVDAVITNRPRRMRAELETRSHGNAE